MSIEQKIAEMLAESKKDQVSIDEQVVELDEEGNPVTADATTQETNDLTVEEETTDATDVVTEGADDSVQTATRVSDTVKEDVDALVNGEDLSEEFKQKAATIFEAAIVTRVKQEVARLEEEFETRLQEEADKNQEGLVEKVDGYLNYVVEQWIANNEIALEHGMKVDILENFVSGLKGLFVESWIDIPEEKYDVVGHMEETIEDLQAKLDEQVAANVEMNKIIAEAVRNEIVKEACEGLTDTEVEKFTSLAEELAYEDAESFSAKVQTIRENYFIKSTKTIVESVVTDEPVEQLTEEKVVDPTMKRYLSALNNIK